MKSSALTLTVALVLLALLHGTVSRPKPAHSRQVRRKVRQGWLPKHLREDLTTLTSTPEPWTTTTPAGCTGPDGQQVGLGQEVRYSDCDVCTCTEWGVACLVYDCMQPMCVDAVRPEGSCCYQCPNGPNCRIPDTGEIISTQVERDGRACWCEFESMWGFYYSDDLTAVCMPTDITIIPPITSTPPMPTLPLCVDDNGEPMFLGQEVIDREFGSCKVCKCTTEGKVCYYGDCLPPMCHDYVISGDQCCYECPNGPNCVIPGTEEVISDQVERDGLVCRCPEKSYSLPGVPSEEYYTAICTPLSTPRNPPETTTTSESSPEIIFDSGSESSPPTPRDSTLWAISDTSTEPSPPARRDSTLRAISDASTEASPPATPDSSP